MEVMWQLGSATVAEVAERLEGEDGSAYTTVLTMMRILRDKGYLSCDTRSRAHVYAPSVDRDMAARSAVQQLLSKFFSGSPGELVLSFLRDEKLTDEELEEIRNQIKESKNKPGKKK